MAKSTTTNKDGTIDVTKDAINPEATASEGTVKTTENVDETKATETNPGKTEKAEKTEGKIPFEIDKDGFVEVISERRAGKTVVGTTGDIITFDNKGHAKVRVEDARHFAKVPGFSFK